MLVERAFLLWRHVGPVDERPPTKQRECLRPQREGKASETVQLGAPQHRGPAALDQSVRVVGWRAVGFEEHGRRGALALPQRARSVGSTATRYVSRKGRTTAAMALTFEKAITAVLKSLITVPLSPSL